jgi:nitrite reductase/ring-hydroxylating ferredoxin subunit
MQRIWLILFSVFLLSCSNDQGQRNPYIQEIGFRFEVNLNLPLYSPLTNPGNPVYIGGQGAGVRGVYVINTGFNVFRAFEASCPNHSPNPCSTTELNGQTAVCSCEGFQYSLFTGQQLMRPEDGNRYYDMLEYRATQGGNVVVITN